MSTNFASAASKSVQLDYALIAREFLRAARGARHTSVLSKRLGYSFDQVKRWESGKTRCLWPDFLRLAAALGLRVRPGLSEAVAYPGAADDYPRLVAHLLAERAVGPVAAQLGVAPGAVRRWLKGKQAPTLPQILALIAVVRRRLAPFLANFVAVESLPHLRATMALLSAEKALHYKLPHVGAVTRAMETKRYGEAASTDTALLAALTGVTARQIASALKALRVAGLAYPDARGKLVLRSLPRIDVNGDFAGEKRLFSYWLGRGQAFVRALQGRPTRARLAYQVFNCSEDTFVKIQAAGAAYFHAVRALLEADTGPTELVAMTSFQVLDLGAGG